MAFVYLALLNVGFGFVVPCKFFLPKALYKSSENAYCCCFRKPLVLFIFFNTRSIISSSLVASKPNTDLPLVAYLPLPMATRSA